MRITTISKKQNRNNNDQMKMFHEVLNIAIGSKCKSFDHLYFITEWKIMKMFYNLFSARFSNVVIVFQFLAVPFTFILFSKKFV